MNYICWTVPIYENIMCIYPVLHPLEYGIVSNSCDITEGRVRAPTYLQVRTIFLLTGTSIINGSELPQLRDQPCLFLQLIVVHFFDTHVIAWRACSVQLSKVDTTMGARTYPGISCDFMKDKVET